MSHKNIFAYTPVGASPPYISINEDDDTGVITCNVRSERRDYGTSDSAPSYTQDHASIVIPQEELLWLMVAIGTHLYGEEVMAKASGFILGAVTDAANIVDDMTETAPAVEAPPSES